MILKTYRKVEEIRKDAVASDTEEKTKKLLEKIDWLKSCDHTEFGSIIAQELSIGNGQSVKFETTPFEHAMISSIKKHAKIMEVIKDIEQKAKKVMERNSAIRAEEQRKEARKARSNEKDKKKAKKTSEKEGNEKEVKQQQPVAPAVPKTRYVGVVRNSKPINGLHFAFYAFTNLYGHPY